MLMLLGLSLALLLVAPIVLTTGRWQVRHPRIALTLWFGAFFAGCTAAGASVLVAVLTAVGVDERMSHAEGLAATVIAWLSLIGIGAIVAVVAAVSEPLAGSHREAVQAFAPLVSSREQRRGFVLARFQSEAPTAYAVRRPEPMIFLSSTIEAALTPTQLQAVLAHERAHLRGRHDWAMRIAEINAACLPPVLPAGAALRRATALLIELIADDTAARQTGAANLANALSRLSEATDDVGMALRAERLTARRWPSSHRRRIPAAVRI
ncbi:MAG: hypothetical protein BGO95_10655 [Micrococcales bacterium 73-13]|nr:MAG: hypothetical protein BGO95_10655 [Micrococcales bacterium 73-13]